MGILIGAQKMCFCLALASRANCCLLELCALVGTKGDVVPCAEDARDILPDVAGPLCGTWKSFPPSLNGIPC